VSKWSIVYWRNNLKSDKFFVLPPGRLGWINCPWIWQYMKHRMFFRNFTDSFQFGDICRHDLTILRQYWGGDCPSSVYVKFFQEKGRTKIINLIIKLDSVSLILFDSQIANPVFLTDCYIGETNRLEGLAYLQGPQFYWALGDLAWSKQV